MNTEEMEAMDALVKAWNAFQKLPEQHTDDTKEFLFNFHACQRVIMSRVAFREYRYNPPKV